MNFTRNDIKKNPFMSWIVYDLRFQNEYEMLKRNHFQFVKLEFLENNIIHNCHPNTHAHFIFNPSSSKISFSHINFDAVFKINSSTCVKTQDRDLEKQVEMFLEKTKTKEVWYQLPIP